MSGRDGSIGYSFFSRAELAGRSLNFDAIGEDEDSNDEQGDPFSGDEERMGEDASEVATDTVNLQSPTEPSDELFRSSFSREALVPGSFGGTTITSAGRWPLASSTLGSPPADSSNLTASITLTEPLEAAQ